MELNQNVLNDFIFYLKKDKFKNIIQTLKIDYCTDEYGEYIYLTCIKIKKSQKQKGYGSAIMFEIIKFADIHNVRIKLWVTNIFGSDLKRLFEFYQKLGFVLIKNYNDGNMIYYDKNI
jgi:GNAT superfamily N-acetyltransferase